MSTNFFDQQEHARRQTGRLVALFVLAVLGIITSVYAVATLAVIRLDRQGHPPVLDGERLAVTAAVVVVIIAAGTLFKMAMLRDGGEAVATMLGGRLVDPSHATLPERRLLNVVEEMAIASGTPVPPVYVLDGEPGINAFAAGYTPGDAVVAVSRGALDHLTRDELQGVVGHEFSHILNGDMRLNLRLIGLIAGILVLATIGQLVVRGVLEGSRWSGGSRSRSRDGDGDGDGKDSGVALVVVIVLCGVALWIIGSIGVLFGRMIQSAVSRQREYLADASSVQFTRNPAGLAGALKKIGGLTDGSRVRNAHAGEACHLFFGQGVPSLSGLFATHPPLVERIRRLEPDFDGTFAPVRDDERVGVDEADVGAAGLAPRRPAGLRPALAGSGPDALRLNPAAAVGTVGAPTPAHVDFASGLLDAMPPALAAAVSEPFSARAVVFALLLEPQGPVRRAQLDHLETHAEPGTADEVIRLAPFIGVLGEPDRIPLVDLTFPALRRLSPRQYRDFRASVDALVRADGRVALFEYALQRMLFRNLDRVFFRVRPPVTEFSSLAPLLADANVLISALAWSGHEAGADVARAYETGMTALRPRDPGAPAVGILPEAQCTLVEVETALRRLARGAPAVKRQVLDACAAGIAYDGVVTLPEAELLRAISDALDCPMPPLLARPA